MNHYAWTYVAGQGRNTKVGLYHSSTTGHLMIYAGKKIVTIDFKVLDSKEYTFFIDDELCKIKLERRGGEMYYFFEIDKETDTPLNRMRWAREKKHLWQMLLTFGVIGILVAAVVVWSNIGKRGNEMEAMLAEQGVETLGKVWFDTTKKDSDIFFQYIASNVAQSGRLDREAIKNTFSKNKLPLEPGDEFVVRYVPSRPSLSRIYLNRPSERQVERYRLRTFNKHIEANAGMVDTMARCLVEVAYELDGIDGLAKLYFQDTSPSENPDHNSKVYSEYLNSYLFRGAIKKRCSSE